MRKRRLIKSIMMITALALCCTGCEKKAEVIDGYNETAEKSGSDAAGGSEVDSSETGASETDKQAVKTKNWNEDIEGKDKGFSNVNVRVAFKEFSNKDLSTTTVEYVEFNADFVKKMCETVFDGGEVLVYDYSHRTKRICDDLLKAYDDTLILYDELESQSDGRSIQSVPFQDVMFGIWSSGTILDPGEIKTDSNRNELMDRSVIEEDIEKLKTQKESAPETIENDYSYGGYLGKINSEEYYMYFGNRNYDEYLNSMDTTQFNGRVVTIMKTDLENEYAGPKVDSQRQPNSIIPGYGYDRMNIDSVELSDDMMAAAEQFLGKIGYGDYIYNPKESGKLYWGNEVSNGFIYSNDYYLRDTMPEISDGARLRFDLNSPDMEKITLYDIQIPHYSKSGDTLDYDSYVDVLVNSNGILGCQIYNPTKVLRKEPVDSILDIDTIKDIVRDSVKDMGLWNICEGRTRNNFDLSQVKLTYFPVRSDVNKKEYTLVPSYIFDGTYMRDGQIINPTIIPNIQGDETPFLIINAIDGSTIKVEDELTDYPSGWNNGNVGYKSYEEEQWNRNRYNSKRLQELVEEFTGTPNDAGTTGE